VHCTIGTLPKPTYSSDDANWLDLDALNSTSSESSSNNKPKVVPFQGKGRSLRDGGDPASANDDDDDELRRAIEMSKHDFTSSKASKLLESLSAEPATGELVVTVQLRLPSGTKVKRRFSPTVDSTEINTWARTHQEVGSRQFNLVQSGVGVVDVTGLGPIQAFMPNVTLAVNLV